MHVYTTIAFSLMTFITFPWSGMSEPAHAATVECQSQFCDDMGDLTKIELGNDTAAAMNLNGFVLKRASKVPSPSTPDRDNPDTTDVEFFTLETSSNDNSDECDEPENLLFTLETTAADDCKDSNDEYGFYLEPTESESATAPSTPSETDTSNKTSDESVELCERSLNRYWSRSQCISAVTGEEIGFENSAQSIQLMNIALQLRNQTADLYWIEKLWIIGSVLSR